MVNKVFMIGRLTRDPEVHETTSGGRLSNMRLVTTEFRKGEDGEKKEEAQFHSVVAFGRLGEICADYLRKGRLVYIEGRLRTREWDGKDGIKRYTTEVIADAMQMLTPRPDDDRSEPGGGEAAEADRVTAGAGA
jgi:single-strand DNA-binding protein